MVTIRSFEPAVGFQVTLNEYADLPALLIISDVSRKKIRQNIKTFCPVGSQQIVSVKNIDERDGEVSIDVSKRDVDPTDAKKLSKHYSLSIKLAGILRRLSHISSKTEQALFENISWKFEKDLDDTESQHPLDLIKNKDGLSELPIPVEYQDLLREQHYKLFGATIIKSNATVTIVMFGIDGQADLNNIFKAVLDDHSVSYSSDELYENRDRFNLSIKPIAPPEYQVSIHSCYRDTCSTSFDAVIEKIKSKTTELGEFAGHITNTELEIET